MDIDRLNFSLELPNIEHAIKTADFIGIDCEFSGLEYDELDKPSLFDSSEDRYLKLRKNVQRFTLLQIGLTTFCGNVQTNEYDTRTFQFYLFPKSFSSHDQKLCIQSSSVHFLRKHQFDFSKWLNYGISFMNDEEERRVSELVDSAVLSKIDRLSDGREMQSLCSYVTAWIPSSQPGDNLVLPITQDFSDSSCYIFHKDLRARFPQVWTGTNAFEQFVVTRVAPEERARLESCSEEDAEESDMRYKEQLLNEMLGFTRVFRMLVAAGKPIVGHNMLTDLLFMMDKFHAPLPEDYGAFKKSVHSVFPAIYDTKHIHNAVRKQLETHGVIFARSLEDLYGILTSTQVMNMSMMQPKILRQTESAVEGSGSKDQVHQAGYDAFLCGSVFLRLCHFLHAKNFSSMEIQPFPFKSYLPTMSRFCNCVNVIRASLTYIKFDSEDPTSLRPPVLYLKSKSRSGLHGTSLAVMLSPHGTVDIKMLSSGEALVATTNYITAREILFAFKKDPMYEVTNYRFWQHSSLGKGIWWGSVIVASGSCLLVLSSLLK